MTQTPAERFICFRQLPNKPRTTVWEVYNRKHRCRVGVVKWYGGFRKYCFFPESEILLDMECMRLIADFLDSLRPNRLPESYPQLIIEYL